MRIAGLFFCCVLLADCSRMTGFSPPPGDAPGQYAPAQHRAPAGIFKTLHNFEGSPDDGATPQAGLIHALGVLYGTTSEGGSQDGACASFGCGTVFAITPSGVEHALYRFQSSPDGASPEGDLVSIGGALYGTTEYGGANCNQTGCGTLFKVSLDGTESVLHSFGSGADGYFPQGGLLAIRQTLYGTTTGGNGAVFQADTLGDERILYAFNGGANDGAGPLGDLIAANGNLYGTTHAGGTQDVGTIFEVSRSGQERVLHSFDYHTDGGDPLAGLVALNGVFYGTTSEGGKYGKGTVFAVTPSGRVHVVHNFEGYAKGDGAYPYASLVVAKGALYGTTRGGGTTGGGTVFEVDALGPERVVYNFDFAPHGRHPFARLLLLGKELYGTTCYGGTGKGGTVFRVSE